MDYAESLRLMIVEYLSEVERLLTEAKPADGLLGMGKAPQHDPCHEAFDHRVEAHFTAAVADNLSPDAAAEVAAVLLFSEKEYDVPNCASWMLIAAHRHCLQIIPLLTSEDAARLHTRYGKAYPFYHRLPVQKELLQALRQR